MLLKKGCSAEGAIIFTKRGARRRRFVGGPEFLGSQRGGDQNFSQDGDLNLKSSISMGIIYFGYFIIYVRGCSFKGKGGDQNFLCMHGEGQKNGDRR